MAKEVDDKEGGRYREYAMLCWTSLDTYYPNLRLVGLIESV